MSQLQEDPATVLEQFVHDVANLPAEINHLMEEIQAKDKTIQECRTTINSRDTSLQKFIKLNGSLTPNPKEEQYSKTILQNLDKSQLLQDEKIQLSEKACVLLDRQIKRLDIAIHKLQSNGMLSNDPPLPSLFNNKDQYRDPPRIFFPDATVDAAAAAAASSSPTAHATNGGGGSASASGGAANLILGATQRLNQSLGRNASTAAAAAAMLSSPSAARSSAPATPSGTVHFQQRHQRESSAGAVENKRRRLNASLGTLPAASSNLRQSSLGPGTPKGGGTPASSRAGSAGPRSSASTTKKALTKKVAPHQQLKKLKTGSGGGGGGGGGSSGLNGKHSKRSSSASGRLKITKKSSPSSSATGPGGHGGGEDDEDDSLLSSADMSDSEHADLRGGAGVGGGGGGGGENDLDEEEDEDEGNEDTKVYCTCRSVSHGDMVACDNEDCEFEWFHWKCVGLTREPVGKWYCPQCSAKLGA